MKPPVKVIIPWRPEPTRQAGFDWLVRYYSHRFGADAVHVEADDTDRPFNKSRLINLAMPQHAGHVCVITDADAFICDWTLREAIRLAGTAAKMILPHNSVCRMTASNRAGCFAGAQPIRPQESSIATSARELVPAADGSCMLTCSIATAWTSGSKAGAARTPSSSDVSPGDGCRDRCFTSGTPRRRRSGSSGTGGC